MIYVLLNDLNALPARYDLQFPFCQAPNEGLCTSTAAKCNIEHPVARLPKATVNLSKCHIMPALPYLAPLAAASQRKNAIELVAVATTAKRARNNRQVLLKINLQLLLSCSMGVSYPLPSPSFLQTGKRGDWSTGSTTQPFQR